MLSRNQIKISSEMIDFHMQSRLADKFPPDNFPPGGTCPKWNLSGGKLSFLDACLPGELVRGTASLGCNRVSNGKTHRCMAKVIYHGKSHGIWVLPYNGLSHGSMVKPMDIMKRYIHGFCHGTLLHGFCHALFKRKVTNCVFTQPGICFGIASY